MSVEPSAPTGLLLQLWPLLRPWAKREEADLFTKADQVASDSGVKKLSTSYHVRPEITPEKYSTICGFTTATLMLRGNQAKRRAEEREFLVEE